MFRPLNSPKLANITNQMGRIRLKSDHIPTNEKQKIKSLNHSAVKTERSSPLHHSTLSYKQSSKTTLNSPRGLQNSKSNITLFKGQSKFSDSHLLKPVKSTISSPRTATKIITKSSQPVKSSLHSRIKSDILPINKMASTTANSSFVKSRIITKSAVPIFSKQGNKPISKMKTIKEEQNATQTNILVQIEQLQSKVKDLTQTINDNIKQISNLKLLLEQKTEQNQILEHYIYKYQGINFTKQIHNKIFQQFQKDIQIEYQALKRLKYLDQQKIKKFEEEMTSKNDKIQDLMKKHKHYEDQLLCITQKLIQVEQQTAQLFSEKKNLEKNAFEIEENNQAMEKSILMKDEEVSELKNSILIINKNWEGKYKTLEGELEHSQLQFLKKQKDLQATRMILEEERGKSFQANQQLMTMITQTDAKNEESVVRLKARIQDLQYHVKSYEEIFEKMEKDIQVQDQMRWQFQAERDKQMDDLQEILQKIKFEGKQFLRLRQQEIEDRQFKSANNQKSSIR